MKYRREIDGLRAVAVLPVIFYHAGFKAFEGGFIGVDVFFVISGYLITTIILSDMNNQKFSIVTFYERRARRILPALFFVMFCCLPFAWLWLIPEHLKEFTESLAAVSVFSSNIFFWSKSGYFSTASELQPLIHTWSLAVEEQYYVLFPLFLMALWKLRKRWIFGSLIVVAIVSLLAAQWGAHHKPSATFYLLPTRAWELAIGALIAFYFLYKQEHAEFIKSHKKTSEAFGVIGLLFIAYSIFVFDKNTPFPGAYALIPTIGTALIIIFSTSETVIGRFLSIKIMVGIGILSYSTYLWHQPLFAFLRYRSLTEPSVSSFLVLSALSIVLAYVSWRFVENPFRDKKFVSRRSVFAFAVIGSLIFIVTGTAGSFSRGYPDRFNASEMINDAFEQKKLKADCDNKNKNESEDIDFCRFGSDIEDADIIAIFGDSHSTALLPAFDNYGVNNNISVIHNGLNGCPPLIGVGVAPSNAGLCEDLSYRQFNYVKENKIRKVYLAARWSMYTDGDYNGNMIRMFLVSPDNKEYSKSSSRINFERSIRNTVDLYNNIGTEVFIILQVPQQIVLPKMTYYMSEPFENKNKFLIKYSVPYEKHLTLQNYNRTVINGINGIKIINLDSIFCNENKCVIGNEKHSYYTDYDHISISDNKDLIEKISTAIENN